MNGKRMVVLLAVAAALWMALSGCVSCKDRASGKDGMSLCTKCGEMKGCVDCCKAGKENCAKCNMHKGAPGCCKITPEMKTADSVALCGKCGEIKGCADCCKAGKENCAKCGMHKGAPGCCKMPVPASSSGGGQ